MRCYVMLCLYWCGIIHNNNNNNNINNAAVKHTHTHARMWQAESVSARLSLHFLHEMPTAAFSCGAANERADKLPTRELCSVIIHKTYMCMLHVARDDEAAAVTVVKREISLPLFPNVTVYPPTHTYICTSAYERVFTFDKYCVRKPLGWQVGGLLPLRSFAF